MTTEPKKSTSNFEKSLNKVDITQEEWGKFMTAMKNKEFRKHLDEYAQELTDPAKRKLYEEEIEMLERERGYDITWVHPNEGYVIKLKDAKGEKCFINICSNNNIEVASCVQARQKSNRGLQWSVPYCQSQPQRDCDKRGSPCTVYDVIFHPDTLYMASKNDRMKDLIEKTAIQAIFDSFGVELNLDNIKYPLLRYKGMRRASVLKRRRSEASEDNSLPQQLIEKLPVQKSCKVPAYTIGYREHPSMDQLTRSPCGLASPAPREMVVRVKLPGLTSAAGLDLEVNARSVRLTGDGYLLELPLPQAVVERGGGATFDSATRSLVIVLPLQLQEQDMRKKSRADSGIATDGDDYCDTSLVKASDTSQSIMFAGNGSDSSNADLSHQSNSDSVISTICDQLKCSTLNDVRNEADASGKSLQHPASDRTVPLDFHPTAKMTESCKSSVETEVSVSEYERVPKSSSHVYTSPTYVMYQDADSVYVTLTQPSLMGDSLKVDCKDLQVVLTVESSGRGQVRFFFRMILLVPENVASTTQNVLPSDELMVIIKKVEPCIWEFCEVGVDHDSLEKVKIPLMVKSKELTDEESCMFQGDPSTSEQFDAVKCNDVVDREVSDPSSVFVTQNTTEETTVKGILKKSATSESSLDEVFASSTSVPPTFGSWMQSGDENDEVREKKAVRFSRHVVEKRYRSNCSITHDTVRHAKQRAKKRRQRARRHSEGDVSASETDDGQSDSGVRCSATSSSDADTSDGDTGHQQSAPMTPKRRKNKRKKDRSRKDELKNQLIFDLDM